MLMASNSAYGQYGCSLFVVKNVFCSGNNLGAFVLISLVGVLI